MVVDEFVETGLECLSLKRVDMMCNKVRVAEHMNVFEPITVVDGVKDYFVVVIPMVFLADLIYDLKNE